MRKSGINLMMMTRINSPLASLYSRIPRLQLQPGDFSNQAP